MQTLDTLEVCLLAKAYRKEVIKTANTFPKEEKFLLTAQIMDSARSITANIAEEYGRYHYQEAINFAELQEDLYWKPMIIYPVLLMKDT
jgi:four helix bundle protein